jgi:hypothetical protein
MRAGFLSLVMTGLVAAAACGDEAVLPDGRRVAGSLGRDAQGRLLFAPTGKDSPLSPEQIDHVRFSPRPAKALLAAAVHRVTLSDGQTLTGELLGIDAERLRLRTAWGGDLTLPRHAVAEVAQPAHWATSWLEDFESEPSGWKLSGEPAFGEKESALGKRGLLLTANQGAEFTLPAPPAAGRFGVSFRQVEKSAGLRWLVELEFRAEGKTRTEKVEVVAEGPAGDWRRLDVEFGPSALVVAVDGDVWHYDREKGPGGPLTRVKLLCEAAGRGPRQGTVAFDDVSLAVPTTPMRHSTADPSQDEVWLMTGDGVFGKVLSADRRGVTFRTGGGQPRDLVLSWGEVRGLFLKREPPPKAAEDDRVRLSLKPGTGTEADQVEGVVRGLDDKLLTLAHPILGELKIGRERLERLWRVRAK